MLKISALSLLVCLLLLVAHYFGGIADMYAFKIMMYTFGGMFLLSTGYGIYELNKDTKKTKQSVVK